MKLFQVTEGNMQQSDWAIKKIPVIIRMMQYDAIKKKAGRKNCGQVDHNTGKRSIDVIGELCGDSAKQVH